MKQIGTGNTDGVQKNQQKKLRGAKQRSQLSIRQKQLRTHDELGIGNSRGMRHR